MQFAVESFERIRRAQTPAMRLGQCKDGQALGHVFASLHWARCGAGRRAFSTSFASRSFASPRSAVLNTERTSRGLRPQGDVWPPPRGGWSTQPATRRDARPRAATEDPLPPEVEGGATQEPRTPRSRGAARPITFEQSTRAIGLGGRTRRTPVSLRGGRIAAPLRHTNCSSPRPEEKSMYYGIGGTILIIVAVLFLMGRI